MGPLGPLEEARRGEGAPPAVGAETSWAEAGETSLGAEATETSPLGAAGAATSSPGVAAEESSYLVGEDVETSHPGAGESSPHVDVEDLRVVVETLHLAGAETLHLEDAETSHPVAAETSPHVDGETLHRGVVDTPEVPLAATWEAWVDRQLLWGVVDRR